jgi:hypothetical protein
MKWKPARGHGSFLRKRTPAHPSGFAPISLTNSCQTIAAFFFWATRTQKAVAARAHVTVVEEVLRHHLKDVEVMNAGVSGYGPLDALNLLRLLREQCYRFEAVVYNLFTENDFTDNLPNTNRRIVAGVIFRVPHSWFLRTFYPLNSYIFRYALVVWRLGSFSAGEEKQISLESGNCIFAEKRRREVSSELCELVRQRLAGSQRVAQSKRAQEKFIKTMAAMKAEADKLRIPFIVVDFRIV